jgi:glycosyltransferase involved in cell wall biosynthesis
MNGLSVDLSIVSPCFNEEEVIGEFLKQTQEALTPLGLSYELIIVDDGSQDRTALLAREAAAADPRIKLVSFSRNFGHQAALTAGLDFCCGRAVVLIDADLQDPPSVIPEMVAKWKEGFEVVYGQRIQRDGETWFKLVTAKAFYRLLEKITAVRIPRDTGDFRLMDAKVIQALRSMREPHRFIRGMTSWTGFRQTPLPYHRQSRHAGETKFSVKKMVLFALDAITSFSILPLRLITWTATIVLIMTIFYALWILTVRLLFPDYFVPGFPVINLLIIGFGGLNLLCLGVIGEYIGRVYEQGKARPLYIVGYTENMPPSFKAPAD